MLGHYTAALSMQSLDDRRVSCSEISDTSRKNRGKLSFTKWYKCHLTTKYWLYIIRRSILGQDR